MATLQLTRVGENYNGHQTYKDENGHFWADIHNTPLSETPSEVYNLCPCDDIDGEPGWPTTDFVILNPPTEREIRMAQYRDKYGLLGRMKADCMYFLGYGNKCEKHLWAGNVTDQIAKMKKLWQEFPDDLKPEWLTWEQILDYERRMSE